jgi:hypothetical protein
MIFLYFGYFYLYLSIPGYFEFSIRVYLSQLRGVIVEMGKKIGGRFPTTPRLLKLCLLPAQIVPLMVFLELAVLQ